MQQGCAPFRTGNILFEFELNLNSDIKQELELKF